MTDVLRDFESPNQKNKDNNDVLASILNQLSVLNKKVESFEILSRKVEQLERKREERCLNCASRASLVRSNTKNNYEDPCQSSNQGDGGYDGQHIYTVREVNPGAQCRGR